MDIQPAIAFLAGSPGPGEIIVIFFFILVLFGPRRLPEIAKMIGKTLHELRRASEDFKDQIMSIETEVVDDVDVDDVADAVVDQESYDDSAAGDSESVPDISGSDGIVNGDDVAEVGSGEVNGGSEDDPYGLVGYGGKSGEDAGETKV